MLLAEKGPIEAIKAFTLAYLKEVISILNNSPQVGFFKQTKS